MLSKSKFIGALQCEKNLWLGKHRPDLRPPISAAQEARFSQGDDVGLLAQQLFPNGKDATPDFSKPDGLKIGLQQTAQWVAEGADVIYEAAFSAGGVYAAMDILVKEGDRWRAIEVKSSTSVKDYHINDAAVQYYVLTQAGLDLADIELMHLNNEYYREGDLELSKLFKRTSLLDQVLPKQSNIPALVSKFTKVIRQEEEPQREIGPHCNNPFECDFKHYCWSHVPSPNVLDITRIGETGWDLLERGIMGVDAIPNDTRLSVPQQNQVNGYLDGTEVWDKPAIRSFLEEWKYPLYFFDFETIMPGIPVYNGTKPYGQCPFQYSLHILKEPGGEVEHRECLADPDAGDPRKELMEQMLTDLGDTGSIVTYNMSFERKRIEELAEQFPNHARALEAINTRVVDLIVPFRSHWCYLPAMNGSASIKAVLPALTDLSYDDLEIKEGGTASNVWLAMATGKFEGDQQKAMEDLRKYCELDTLAMVEVWRVLWERCGK